MAIFPFSNAYVINKDAVAGSSFKAGMVLVTNSAGNVVPADSQLLLDKSLSEKKLSIIGIAAGDSNISGNTIIVPDYIGSNYLDSNSNFVSISDREYFSVKRQLLDYADETVNEYYNINYSPKPKRRGIGVYPLKGDTFATDQFSPVLHGDYGLDSSTTITFSPGDPLTFGGGINAGKLVKVNLNSFGPDVLVVGVVDRYNSSTGLLYYTQASYGLSFGGASSTILALDAGLTVSYPGSGSNWLDLSGNARNFTLTNGPVYSSNPITVLVWYNSRSFSSASIPDGLISNYENGNPGFDIRKIGTALHISQAIGSGFVDVNITNTVIDNTWYNIAITYDGTSLITYTNGASVNTVVSAGTRLNGTKIVIGTSAFDVFARTLACFVSEVRILNRALTAIELLSYYNATKGRYGL